MHSCGRIEVDLGRRQIRVHGAPAALGERAFAIVAALVRAPGELVTNMCAEGLVRLDPNPHHRRAPLVAMTARGEAAYADASERQRAWADDLAAGLSPAGIEAAGAILRELQRRLDAATPDRPDLDPGDQPER